LRRGDEYQFHCCYGKTPLTVTTTQPYNEIECYCKENYLQNLKTLIYVINTL